MAESKTICQSPSLRSQQRKQFPCCSFGKFNVVNLVVQFDQFHGTVRCSNPLE